MKPIKLNKHIFSIAVSAMSVVLMYLLENELTAFHQVFEPSTLISLGLYASGIFIVTEYWISLLSKKIVEQHLVFVFAAILGVVCGFLGMLAFQLLIVKLWQ